MEEARNKYNLVVKSPPVLPPGGLKTPCPLKGTRDSWRNNSMEA
jgi:hypothetical protein